MSQWMILRHGPVRAMFMAGLLLGAMALGGPSFATTAGGAIQGTLYDPSGVAVTNPSVNFKVQVLDKSGACVLYEEIHPSLDLSQTNGDFSFDLGYGTSSANNVTGGTTLDENVFRNDVNLPASPTCPTGVVVTTGDERLIHVQFDLGAGYTALAPDMRVQGGAYAAVAQTVQGRSPANFIQVVDDGTTALNQVNTSNIFSVANYAKLLALLAGTSPNYQSTTPTSTIDENGQRVANVGAPTTSTDAATRGYADGNVGGKTVDVSAVGTAAGNGDTLVWSTAQNKWVATALAVSGTAGGDLTGSYPSPTIANNAITSAKINSSGGGINRLLITDGVTGSTVAYASCALNQIMAWTASGWACTNPAALAPVTSVAGKTGAVVLNAADVGGLGTVALLDVGTAAGQAVALNGTAQLPAVDGSLLTGVNAAKLQGRAVAATAPTSGQLLGWNSVSTQWEPTSVNASLSFPLLANPNGSAGAPAYSFNGSANTGLFSPATNQVAIATAGTTALTLGANGNMGLGTTGSSAKLNVFSPTGMDVASFSGPFGVSTFDQYGSLKMNSGIMLSNYDSNVSSAAITTYNQPLYITSDGGGGGGSNHNILIKPNGIGNVGIGSSNPNAILDVFGTGAQSALLVPRDTAANRPTGVNGMIRYNTSGNAIEAFANGSWQSLAAGSGVGTVQNIVTSTGLLGGTITSSGTISVNAGTGSAQIVQENASSQIAQSAGSATAPSYSFVNNLTSGLFSPGAGTTALATNGTARLTIDSSGNVGIGTNAPTFPVQIKSTVSQAIGVFQPAPSSNFGILEADSYNFATQLFTINWQDGNGTRVTSNNNLAFATSNTGNITLMPSGNVGVGTIVPMALFDIYGTGAQSAMIVPRDTTANRPTGVNGMIRYNTSNNVVETFTNGAWQTIATGSSVGTLQSIVTGTGLLGGTITSTGTISVNAGAAPAQIVQENANAQIAQSAGSATNPAYAFATDTTSGLYSAGVGTASLATNGTARLTIDGFGNVGIGTSSPTNVLTVAGDALINGVTVGRGSDSASTILGQSALAHNTTGFNNAAVGQSALGQNTSGKRNAALGFYSLGLNTTGYSNAAYGAYSAFGNTTGQSNVAVGYSSLSQNQSTSNNTAVGANALWGGGGGNNVGVGSNAGYDLTTGAQNIFIGYYPTTGVNITTGSNNILIGQDVRPTSQTVSNTLNIGNLIFGTNLGVGGTASAGSVGLGTSAPLAMLDVYATGAQSALVVPRDTAANRPNGVNGMIRYNTSGNVIEAFTNGSWQSLAAGSGVGTVQNIVTGTGLLGGTITSNGTISVNVGTGASQIAQLNSSAQMTLNSGNSASPAYAFANSSNTGFFSPTINQIGLSAAGTTALIINASGNIGVGTTSPVSTLSIAKGGGSGPNAPATITAANSYLQLGGAEFYGGSYRIIGFGTYNSGSTYMPAYIGYQDMGVGGQTAGDLIFGTRNSNSDVQPAERMRINYAGNVGLGTSSPAGSLDIYGTGAYSSMVVPRDTTANRPLTAVNGMIRYASDTAKFEVFQSGSWQNMLGGAASSLPLNGITAATGTSSIDNTNYSQNWNWSTAATQTAFTKSANALTTGTLESLISSSNALNSTSGILNVANTGTSTSGVLARFQSNSTAGSGLTVLTNGNVGIGSLSPAYPLDVNGNINGSNVLGGRIFATSGNVNYPGYAFNQSGAGNGMGMFLVAQNVLGFTTSTSERLRIDASGNVGVGTFAPGAILDAYATGAQSSLLVPRDTAANRPTGLNGMVRYNTTVNAFEFFQNNAWVNYNTGTAGAINFPLLASPQTAAPGAPSYSFSGNSNTGLFSPATNQLALSTAGTTAITILANGLVGIGTTTPSVALEVNGGIFTHAGSTFLGVNNVGAMYAGTNSAATPAYGFIYSSDTGLFETSTGSHALGIATAGLERMRVDSAGRVGIGSPTPASALDVYATGAQSAIVVPRDIAANRPTGVNGMLRYNTSNNAFEFFQNNAWVSYNTGSAGTINFPLLASPQTAAPGAPSYSFSGNSNTGLFSPATNQVAISTSGTTALTVSASGYVGIGTTTPNYGLDVSSVINTSGSYKLGGTNAIAVPNSTSIVIGNSLVSANTSASQFTSVGYHALNSLTTGANNTALGANALSAITTQGTNTAIGSGAMASSTASASTAVGAGALSGDTGGSNTAIGRYASNNNGSGFQNAAVGASALYANQTGSHNTAMGFYSLFQGRGDGNSALGEFAGQNISTGGNYNTVVGRNSGSSISSGSYNIVMGAGSDVASGTSSYQLSIGNLIYGTGVNGSGTTISTGSIGIGTAAPAALLDVYGTGSQSAMLVPRDIAANRPTGVNGMLRYNTSNNAFEFFQNNAWVSYNTGSAGITSFPLLASPQTAAPGAPSYSFSGNSNTGLFSPATNQLALATSGITALTVSSSGAVGIGTATPTGNLHVFAGSAPSLNVASSAGTNWTLAGASGAGQYSNVAAANDSVLRSLAPGNTIISNQNSGNIHFTTGSSSANDTAKLTIASGGNIGIANTNPGNRLSITGDGSGSAILNMSNPGSGTGYTSMAFTGSGRTYGMGVGQSAESLYGVANKFYISDITGNSMRLVLDSAGNVGVGTTAPASFMDVYGTGAQSAMLVPRDTAANRPTGVNGMLRYNTSANAFEFFQNNAWVSYGTSGAVGSVAFPLLASPATTAQSSPSYSFSGNTNTGMFSPATNQLALSTSGTAAVSISPAGYVGVGTMSPSAVLHVAGTSSAAFQVGNGAYPGLKVDASQSSGILLKGNNVFSESGPLILASTDFSGVVVTSCTGCNASAFITQSTAQFLMGAVNDSTASDVRFQVGPNFSDVGLTASTEAPLAVIDMSATRTHANGNITLQRDFRVRGTPHAFTSGTSNITDSAVFSVDGPSSAATNATITNASAFYIPTSNVSGGGSVTNSYGLNITAATGATNNYAAIFNGGNVGIGTATPLASLDIYGTGSQSAMLVPRDIAGNRPTGVNGMLRYNTSTNAFEFFQNNAWVSYNTGSAGATSFPLLASPQTAAPGAPSYSFSGNTNTGLFSPATNQVAIATAGTTALTISATGNIGIATSNPGATLDVNGGFRTGSSTVVNAACNAANEGVERYNYGTHFKEYCNGTNWIQLVAQAAGTTTPVIASGPPVGANTYAILSGTGNYTPGFGSVANTFNGNWPANGSNAIGNANCVELDTVAASTEQIVYDLGSNRVIGNVYVAASGNYVGVMLPSISFSTDGATFTSSFTVSSLGGGANVVYADVTLGTAVTARYIRLTNGASYGNQSNYSSFCQIAFGP